MATLGRLKRGSVQIQRAAIQATGRLGARTLMASLVLWALVLQGLVQDSATVALMALSQHLSSEEFAEYVANTSYVKRYCRSENGSADASSSPDPDPATEPATEPTTTTPDPDTTPAPAPATEEADKQHTEPVNASDTTLDPPFAVHEPGLKVPLSEEDSTAALLHEAFLWGGLLGPLPAARLAARLGPKRVMGAAVLAAGALAALVPFAWFSAAHVLIRMGQGLCYGSTWPALHSLGAAWYPPLQRTGFVSYYAAVSLGRAAVGLLGTPLVRLAGRDWLCYALSLLSLLWFLAWLRLVHDSPAQHPRVTADQCRRLQAAIGPSLSAPGTVAPVPWRAMLRSQPLWACAAANLGSQWGQSALQLAVTKYLRLVYGFALTHDRVLWVLPAVGHCLTAVLLGRLADHARATDLVSTTTARRLLVYASHFPAGAILFVVGYSGCDPTTPAALYTAAVVTSGATAAGVHASALDLAPNYAGTVFGLSQTVGAAGGLAGSYVVTEALHGSLPGSWRLVFALAAFMLATSGMAFLGFGSGSAQPWNGGAPASTTTSAHASPRASAAAEPGPSVPGPASPGPDPDNSPTPDEDESSDCAQLRALPPATAAAAAVAALAAPGDGDGSEPSTSSSGFWAGDEAGSVVGAGDRAGRVPRIVTLAEIAPEAESDTETGSDDEEEDEAGEDEAGEEAWPGPGPGARRRAELGTESGTGTTSETGSDAGWVTGSETGWVTVSEGGSGSGRGIRSGTGSGVGLASESESGSGPESATIRVAEAGKESEDGKRSEEVRGVERSVTVATTAAAAASPIPPRSPAPDFAEPSSLSAAEDSWGPDGVSSLSTSSPLSAPTSPSASSSAPPSPSWASSVAAPLDLSLSVPSTTPPPPLSPPPPPSSSPAPPPALPPEQAAAEGAPP